MRKKTIQTGNIWLLVPLLGTLVFLILYVIGSLVYPGGSQMDKHSEGFSWMNNYWCNLLGLYAINGEYNPARPIAITGMFVLCVTMSVFWYLFPKRIEYDKNNKLIIQLSGSLSMSVAMFVFTEMHDAIINTAGLLGIIAIVGSLIGLYKIKWYGLMIFGSLNLGLLLLNNYIYHIKIFIVYLPMIQKISFISYLIWICIIDIKFFNYKQKISGNKI